MHPSHINLLEKFSTWTAIIPYFGRADRSFLLLSMLNKKTRKVLDENYDAILNWLMNTATWLKIEYQDQKELLMLPWNLFQLSIRIYDEEQELLDTFIKLIWNINSLKGYYFNKHFMHSRLFIEELIIDEKMVNKLYPILELLKTTEALLKEDNLLLEKPLIEFFSVSWKPIKKYPLKEIFNNLIECKEKCWIEPVFEWMRRIHHLNMRSRSLISHNSTDVLSIVCDMGFKIDEYSIEPTNLEELKLLTNPEFFKGKINLIKYWLNNNDESLADDFF